MSTPAPRSAWAEWREISEAGEARRSVRADPVAPATERRARSDAPTSRPIATMRITAHLRLSAQSAVNLRHVLRTPGVSQQYGLDSDFRHRHAV